MKKKELELDLLEKEIQGYKETHINDPDGIVYDGINCETNKPFTKKEAPEFLYPHKDSPASPDGNGRSVDVPIRFSPITNYEDSDMATADYLVSQIYRYMVNGDTSALRIARRCFQAIAAIFAEGSKRHPGFLPKPYGGIKGASHSNETSIDQYSKVVLALDMFRSTIADKSERKQAEEMIISMAEYWDRQNFTTMYFGKSTQWIGPHPNAFAIHLMALAYTLTKRKVFLCWYDLYLNRVENLFNNEVCSGNMAHMIVRSMADLLILRPEHSRLWKRAIRHNYPLAVSTLHPSGYACAHPPRDKIVAHGVSTLLADTAVCVAQVNKTKVTLKVAEKVLLTLGEGKRIFHTLVLNHLRATKWEIQESKRISGYYMAGWELAYWHRRWLKNKER